MRIVAKVRYLQRFRRALTSGLAEFAGRETAGIDVLIIIDRTFKVLYSLALLGA